MGDPISGQRWNWQLCRLTETTWCWNNLVRSFHENTPLAFPRRHLNCDVLLAVTNMETVRWERTSLFFLFSPTTLAGIASSILMFVAIIATMVCCFMCSCCYLYQRRQQRASTHYDGKISTVWIHARAGTFKMKCPDPQPSTSQCPVTPWSPCTMPMENHWDLLSILMQVTQWRHSTQGCPLTTQWCRQDTFHLTWWSRRTARVSTVCSVGWRWRRRMCYGVLIWKKTYSCGFTVLYRSAAGEETSLLFVWFCSLKWAGTGITFGRPASSHHCWQPGQIYVLGFVVYIRNWIWATESQSTGHFLPCHFLFC